MARATKQTAVNNGVYRIFYVLVSVKKLCFHFCNSIPTEITSSPSINIFKASIKNLSAIFLLVPNMQTIYETDRLYRITGKQLWIDVFSYLFIISCYYCIWFLK